MYRTSTSFCEQIFEKAILNSSRVIYSHSSMKYFLSKNFPLLVISDDAPILISVSLSWMTISIISFLSRSSINWFMRYNLPWCFAFFFLLDFLLRLFISSISRNAMPIQTKDVNSSDYQSKLIEGVYVIGEALDVDGDCGGYNLSFAFSSGVKCARAIKTSRS